MRRQSSIPIKQSSQLTKKTNKLHRFSKWARIELSFNKCILAGSPNNPKHPLKSSNNSSLDLAQYTIEDNTST